MKIAVISDIHGNMEALGAVIADIDAENVDKILVCGDLAMGGPEPAEVIDFLIGFARRKEVFFVLGNTDEMILKANDKEGASYLPGDETMKAALGFTQKALSTEQITFLAGMPESQIVKIGELGILMVHGSPRSISENVLPDLSEDIVKQMIQGHDEDIIFCGHTHLPVVYEIGRQAVVNTGSVGRPFTEKPYASYVILDILDISGKYYGIRHKLVKYDNQVTADKLMKLGFDGCDKLAKVIVNPIERHKLLSSRSFR